MSNAVVAGSRKSRQPSLVRAVRNLAKLPVRTLTSARRWFNPEYRLEREANRAVNRWIPAERRQALDAVPGMSSPRECRLLAYLAAQSPDVGEIVEIGAWMGRSTAWLVEGSTHRARLLPVVSIDPHERNTWQTFQETCRKFELPARGLTVHRARSDEVGRGWRKPISLLWVDGCHEYDAVRQDILDFTPHVSPGGWVVFDDAAGGHFPGVERAIAEQMNHDPAYERIGTLRHLAIFRRQT